MIYHDDNEALKKLVEVFIKKRLAIDGLKLYTQSDDYGVYTQIRKKTILCGWLSPVIATLDFPSSARTFRVLKKEWYSTLKQIFEELYKFYPNEKYKIIINE